MTPAISTDGFSQEKQSNESDSSFSDDENKLKTFNLSSVKNDQKIQNHTNWVLDVIVFNIARLRLEQFTSVKFNDEENLTSMIHTKILESDGNIKSMIRHFTDYLIRSCKRRGIISRRLLLVSNGQKKSFIRNVCNCLLLLPDQLIGSSFTKQQMLKYHEARKL